MTFENSSDIPYIAPDSELSKLMNAMENSDDALFNN
jgi:hypothetical protein